MSTKQNMDLTAELLNDLIRINNDRIAGYEKARKEVDSIETGLQDLFRDIADESRRNVAALRVQVNANGGEPVQGTTLGGKVYRMWMDVKATFYGNDPKAILASCEFGEGSALKAYEAALESTMDSSPEIIQLILDQKTELESALDSIRLHTSIQTARPLL